MSNIFVCHRPYQAVRSYDLATGKYKGDVNILVIFNLIDINTNLYQDFINFGEIEKAFTKVLKISRNDDVHIFNLKKFDHYYKEKVAQFKSTVDEFGDCKRVFFFSDLERPVEILVSLIKEKTHAKTVIVDEGIAAYYKPDGILWRNIVKKILVKVKGYRYLNTSASYGQSHIYDEALASFPDKCIFKKPIYSLDKLNSDLLSNIAPTERIFRSDKKHIIYVSSILNFAPEKISCKDESNEIQRLIEICSKVGYDFYIKPHPVQDISYYKSFSNELIIDPKIPVELLFRNNVIIISVVSSSMINAYFQQVETIDISELFEIKRHYKLFDDLKIKRPINHKEFEIILSRLYNKMYS